MDWSYGANSILVLNPDTTQVLCIKLKPDNIGQSVAGIRNTWENIFGDHQFKYSFLEDDIRSQYREMDTIVTMFAVLSAISIIIACLGVFGLVSYTVERKSRDTAIRRVLGASTAAVFKGLTKDFVVLIILANIIAGPLDFWLITLSLEEYPFRTSIGLETYLLGGVLTIALALAVSAFHVTKAAMANPVDALKYE